MYFLVKRKFVSFKVKKKRSNIWKRIEQNDVISVENYVTTFRSRSPQYEGNKNLNHIFKNQRVVTHTTIDIQKTTIRNDLTLSKRDRYQMNLKQNLYITKQFTKKRR